MKRSFSVPVLIPAYQPGRTLVDIVDALLERGVQAIIVVDDGSSSESADYFRAVAAHHQVHLVRHAVNLGKGAALKTGMNYALVHFPGCRGVVTADADGQHHADDIVRIAKSLEANPGALIMGVRSFSDRVPLRSRLGNGLTRVFMRLVLGQKLADTQTGLRGIPSEFIPHLLRVPSTGYEFELDMLIACKHQGCAVLQEPIRTIYLDGNKSSHFHPILDSVRIYFVLLRFSALSLLTAVIDNAVFMFGLAVTGSIGGSQAAARLVAMIFNYFGARSVVFHSRQKQSVVLPKYVLLVIANGLLSYTLIQVLHSRLGIAVVSAKLFVEGLLFIANFAIQRDFVFTRREPSRSPTDWDEYYRKVPAPAKLTRRYTTRSLVKAIKRFAPETDGSAGLSIVEMGGANSWFLERILGSVDCRSYDVVDNNEYGLTLLTERLGDDRKRVHLHEQNVLALSLGCKADVVFSVGLVEHFEPDETRQAVLAHFEALRPGGIAIISFPVPTLPYRLTRKLAEVFRLWRFPDERALAPDEVACVMREFGEIIYQATMWPLILTQRMIVARKRTEDRQPAPPVAARAAYSH